MNYELVYILSPKLLDEEVKKQNQSFIKFLEENGVKNIKENIWGKRSLTYRIKGFSDGHYTQFNFEVAPEKVKDIDKKLKLIDEVIRFLIVKQEEVGEIKTLQEAEKPIFGKREMGLEVEKPKLEFGEEFKPRAIARKKEGKVAPEAPKKVEKKPKKEMDLDKKLEELLGKDVV
jgi:small subunit ribosomal protein S6